MTSSPPRRPLAVLVVAAVTGVLAALVLWLAVRVAVAIGDAHRADMGVVLRSLDRVQVLAVLAVVPVALLVGGALLRTLPGGASATLRVLAVLAVVADLAAASYAVVTTLAIMPSDLDVYATCLLLGGLAATVLGLAPAVLLARGRVRAG